MNSRTVCVTLCWISLVGPGAAGCGASTNDSTDSNHTGSSGGHHSTGPTTGVVTSGGPSSASETGGPSTAGETGGDSTGSSGASGPTEGGNDSSGSSDSSGPGSESSGSPLDIPGWTLTFHDEFEGDALDPAKGWLVYGGPQGNAPDFSHFDPAQVSVSDGALHLKIEKREVNGRPYACGGVEPALGTVQTYGRWVARVRFPPGKGNVGYIGLFGETTTEIDFGEVAGKSPLANSFTQHWGDGESEQYTWSGTDSTADFHEYTLIWEPGTLTWLVDGEELHQMTQHFDDAPLLFAMGDWAAPCDIDWAGCPDDTTPYPAYMDVDYVRIYKKE